MKQLIFLIALATLVTSCGSFHHKPSKHSYFEPVTLNLGSGQRNGCGIGLRGFNRILPNSEVDWKPNSETWTVPEGKLLIITDVAWLYTHPKYEDAAGTWQALRLFLMKMEESSESVKVFESTIFLNKEGYGGTNVNMTSGFAVAPNVRICPDIKPGLEDRPAGLRSIIMHGYLINN